VNSNFLFPSMNKRATAMKTLDWRRRDVKDGFILLGLSVLIYLAAHVFDLPPKLFQFALDHTDWEIDDVLFVIMMLSVALLFYIERRRRDLVVEVQARCAAEAESYHLARHDPLTGLPNRRFFSEKLDEMLLQGAAAHERTAVLMLDLDGFKAINDVHGHGAGDQALIEFTARINSVLRAGTFLARFGGDEFAIVISKIELDDPLRLAHRVVAALAKPLVVGGVSATLGVCVGISIAPVDGTTREELVRRADLALYRAKADGRSVVRFFELEMDQDMERRALIERELRAAVAASAVAVHFQPLVTLEKDQIIGFEALGRWTSPSLGPISPQEFIGVAEECGLIGELGDQLLRIACSEAARWPANLMLAFNLSPIQLRDPGLGLRILAILSETGLDPRRLELEVTESALLSDGDVARSSIDALRAVGVRIALDDFGTGYATMAQLLALRFDKIKIDRSFVDRLGLDQQTGVIVRATIGLAKGLGLASTAEGVETANQLAILRADGCLQAQGFLLGQAVAASEIPDLLSRELQVVA